MSQRTLPNRRTVLQAGTALIASMAMLSPHRDAASADVATPSLRTTASPAGSAPTHRHVPVGLL